jgi:hypothetical protein
MCEYLHSCPLIDILLCQIDDPQKISYFIDGLPLAVGIVTIASKGFVAESGGNLSDSDDFPSRHLPTQWNYTARLQMSQVRILLNPHSSVDKSAD